MCCTETLRDLASSGEAARLRHAAGLTQKDLAAGLGLSRAAMSMVEAGREPCPWDRAPGYLRVLRGLANHEAVSRELERQEAA